MYLVRLQEACLDFQTSYHQSWVRSAFGHVYSCGYTDSQADSEHRSATKNAKFLAGSSKIAQVQTVDGLTDAMLCLIQ